MRVKFFTEINTPRAKNFVYFDLLKKIVKCIFTDDEVKAARSLQ